MSDAEISAKLENTSLNDDEFADFPKKKKSTKKVLFEDDLDSEAKPKDEANEFEDDAFSELKKKKKKSKKPKTFEDELEDKPAETEEVDESFLDLSSIKKKKKKSKKNMAAFEAELEENSTEKEANSESASRDVWRDSDRDYTYVELLDRFYSILRENNPELAGEKRKYTIVPPQIVRDGNKKSIFVNLPDICKRMHRPPEHVIQYLFAELGTSGSVDGNGGLVIKGRFQQKQIENVLRRYIMEYVTCGTCRSGETILTKENRLYFVQCESCGSIRSVAPIKTGFQAQTVKRSVARRAVA
ncbi:putative eukaryotic translation initiation factor 2 subunit beta [Smittium mucronatum]|uniref:Putative eukaryotic translation initiation factor 2 subunit beta n=1 Tax=Smittium mucronatum TaxID=133383 RepID=A0A1R0H4V6_9FUNG|nr:putative eukaryotic translation initiation factor 2 subunit beta [Smittium mucronatum]OLY84205.1 putative eukaryotic translation initiation factor 2 subunit beta [Smittium mucronatum]